jgi:hypothetical protein
MMVDLGGPGTPCSATRVRRLVAGELQGAERERTQEHVDGCARCQSVLSEIAEERVRLARDVPFESFAAGVAEKLARPQQQPRFTRWAPFAAAAALLLVVSVSFGVRHEPTDGRRTKGGAAVALFQREGTDVRRLTGPAGNGPIMVRLEPSGHAYAAVVLVEPHESSLLYAGPARSELPQAFEWTGTAPRAMIVAVFADQPLDGETIRRDGAKGAPNGAETVQVPLERGP